MKKFLPVLVLTACFSAASMAQDKVTPLKGEAQSKEYLSKPAR